MKRCFCILALGAIVFASCQREEVFVDRPNEVKSDVLVVDTKTRSYDEALAIAEDALKLLEGDETRSTNKRVIKRSEGQTVMRPVTRGSETEEEPIMYVFNIDRLSIEYKKKTEENSVESSSEVKMCAG